MRAGRWKGAEGMNEGVDMKSEIVDCRLPIWLRCSS